MKTVLIRIPALKRWATIKRPLRGRNEPARYASHPHLNPLPEGEEEPLRALTRTAFAGSIFFVCFDPGAYAPGFMLSPAPPARRRPLRGLDSFYGPWSWGLRPRAGVPSRASRLGWKTLRFRRLRRLAIARFAGSIVVGGLRSWGLRPRLYAFAGSAGSLHEVR